MFLQRQARKGRVQHAAFQISLVQRLVIACSFSLAASLAKRLYKLIGYHLRMASLEIATLEHFHQLTILNKGDSWRRRRVSREVSTSRVCRIDISTSKHSD